MTRLATPGAILVDYIVGVCATVACSSGRVALVKRINLSFNLQIFRLPSMSRLPIFYRPQPGVVAIQLMAPDSPGVKLVVGDPTGSQIRLFCLRSTISNNKSCTSQLRSGTYLLGSTTLLSLYSSIFLYA